MATTRRVDEKELWTDLLRRALTLVVVCCGIGIENLICAGITWALLGQASNNQEIIGTYCGCIFIIYWVGSLCFYLESWQRNAVRSAFRMTILLNGVFTLLWPCMCVFFMD